MWIYSHKNNHKEIIHHETYKNFICICKKSKLKRLKINISFCLSKKQEFKPLITKKNKNNVRTS